MKRWNIGFCILWVFGVILYSASGVAAAGRGAFADDYVGARASIFGEAFVAVVDDANALRWNPAGLTQLLQPEVTSSHINLFSMGGYVDYSSDSSSINEDFIGFVLPNHIAPVGISFLNLGTRGMMLTTRGGAVMNTYASYAERIFTLSVGKRLEAGGFGLSVGWNINRFSVNAHRNSSGFGLDTGLLLDTPGILPDLGVMLKGSFMETGLDNGGPTIPAKADFGIAFSPARPIKLVGGLSKTFGDSLIQYSMGAEYVLLRLSPLSFSVLAGYKSLGSLEAGSLTSQGNHMSVGFCARLSRYKLDYAYEQHSELGDTHRVTFGILQNSPENFHLRQGRQAFEHLDNTNTILELDEAVYLATRNPEVYHLLALTYERMRQKDEAIGLLERVQSLDYDYFMEQNLDQMIEDIQEQE